MDQETSQSAPVTTVAARTNGSAAPAPLWRRILFHPLMAVPLFILITQELKEDWYPFSNFPMYSNPSEWDDYFYLADSKDEPLRIQFHIGMSSAKLKKIFHTTRKEHGLNSRALQKEAPPEVEKRVGDEVLAKARRWAENRNRPLPEGTRLYRVIIERRNGELHEITSLITEG